MKRTNQKKIDPLYITCLHEAGHVVAALALNVDFEYASAIPNAEQNSLGHVTFVVPSQKLVDEFNISNFSPEGYQYFKNDMIIYLAGQAAVARYLKKPFEKKGFGGDLKNFVDIGLKMFPNIKVLRAYFAYVIEEANSITHTPEYWKAITSIAKQLYIKKKLPYVECNLIYANQFHLL